MKSIKKSGNNIVAQFSDGTSNFVGPIDSGTWQSAFGGGTTNCTNVTYGVGVYMRVGKVVSGSLFMFGTCATAQSFSISVPKQYPVGTDAGGVCTGNSSTETAATYTGPIAPDNANNALTFTNRGSGTAGGGDGLYCSFVYVMD